MTKKRNSNIELIRIISIVMIVVSHYCVHGVGINEISKLQLGFNRYILEFLVLGNLGSILFVLIAGYYLSNSNKIKIKKLLHLLFQIIFYSIIIYFLTLILKINTFSIKGLLEAFFPISFKKYWFATCYIILYLFHPFINKMLNSFSKKDHFLFITLMFLIFSILNTLLLSDYYGNELIQFVLFYSIGSYFSKYPENFFGKNNNSIKIMIISSLIIMISIIVFDFIGTKINFFNTHSTYLLGRTSPFAILFCCSLFSYFIRKKEYENKFVNLIGSLIFGVYLISDNKQFRIFLWKDILKNVEYINSPFLILHIIFVVTITIAICLIIEYIRKKIIEVPLFKLLDNKIDLFQISIESKINKIK